MKYYNKKNKYFLGKAKFINKLVLITAIFILLLSLFWYFKLNLFLNDRYDWYVYSAYKNMGINSEKALDYANKAIEIDYNRPEAYYEKVRVLIGLRRYSEAEAEMKAFKIRFQEHLPYYYWRMGWIKLNQNRANESMMYFENGIEYSGNNGKNFLPFYYAGKGYFYLKYGDFENALSNFNWSLRYISYINESSYSHRKYNNLKKRIEYDKESAAAYAHAGMSAAYQGLGMHQKAQEELKTVESSGLSAEYLP